MRTPSKDLTPNQLAIADWAATGRLVKEIADKLGRSTQTISNTLPKIYDKVGIPHNIGALGIWRMCMVNKIELPEFLRGTGAILLLTLLLTTLNVREDNTMRARRNARRGRHEYELTTNQIEA